MSDSEHKDTADTARETEHDIIDVEADAVGATSDGAPSSSSGGGVFVWLLAVGIVVAAGGYSFWPYVSEYVNPYLRDARAALGMEDDSSQPYMPDSAMAQRPAPAPSGMETAPESPATPEPAPIPETAAQMPTEMPAMPMAPAMPSPPVSTAPMAAAPQPSPAQDMPAQDVPDYAPIIQSLTTRIDVLEAQLNAALRAGGGDETQARAALDAAGHLARTLDELKAQVATLNTRLNAMESQPRGRIDPTASSQALVLAVSQLQSRAVTGDPFGAELDALEAVAASRGDIVDAAAALRPMAGGVVTLTRLKDGFPAMAGEVMRVHGASDQAGWWAEVKDTVGGLVTVRRTDPARIDDPIERALAVAEQALNKNDLKTAVAALSGLNGAEAQAALGWLNAARARVAVLDGVQSLQAMALAALSQTGSSQPGIR